MENETSKVLESRLAYKIVRSLAVNMEQKYSKEIADELGEGTTKQSVSNYLKKLRDISFIARGKRTKAQYYAWNFDGIYTYWFNKLESNLEDIEEKVEKEELERYQMAGLDQKRYGQEIMKDLPKVNGETELEQSLEDFLIEKIRTKKDHLAEIKQNDRFRRFMEVWIKFYFDQTDAGTLGGMLFDDLQTGLQSIKGNEDIIHPELDNDVDTILFALNHLGGGEYVSMATRAATVVGLSREVENAKILNKPQSKLLDAVDGELARKYYFLQRSTDISLNDIYYS